MKPYYEKDGIVIYHGDCREILPQLNADVVVTDPPYNTVDMGAHHRRYENSIFPMGNREYIAFCAEWFACAESLTSRIAFTPGIAHAWNYPQPKWVLAWHKPAAKAFNRMGGYNAWEPILVYGKAKGRFGNDVFTLVPRNWSVGVEKDHPCPKPIALWAWIVKGMAVEGDVVADPFLGSGTTLRVAKNLGLKAIGIEVEERYCEMAANRLAQEVLPLTAE